MVPKPGTKISRNTFSRNESNQWSGALSIKTFPEEINNIFIVLVEKNYFFKNSARNSGALTVSNVPICLQNNVFRSNQAKLAGGAIYVRKDYNLAVGYLMVSVNNSFFDNSAYYGGAIYSMKSKASFVNTIFFNDLAIKGPEIYAPFSRDTIRVSHSNLDFSMIWGNRIDEGGNLSGDPIYEDMNILTLSAMSQCIDMGDESYTCNFGYTVACPDCDIDGIPRPSNGVTDMGAHELVKDRSFKLVINDAQTHVKHRIYPNPAMTTLTFEYETNEPGKVNIAVYDLTGKKLTVVMDEYQPAGRNTIEWNTENLPEGVYIYRIIFGDLPAVSGKLVKQ